MKERTRPQSVSKKVERERERETHLFSHRQERKRRTSGGEEGTRGAVVFLFQPQERQDRLM